MNWILSFLLHTDFVMTEKPLFVDVNGHDGAGGDVFQNGIDDDLLSPKNAPKPCMYFLCQ